MQIRKLTIDQFLAWRDFTLPLESGGLTVLYGANEAGKTSLLKFLRGMLYGFPAGRGTTYRLHDRTRPADAQRQAGTLHIEHAGRELTIRREALAGRPATLTIDGDDPHQPPDDLLREALCDVSAEEFETIYAIGLDELQELATLHENQIAQRIYGVSLGSAGRRILTALERSTTQRRLLAPTDDTGRLRQLMQQLDRIDRQQEELGDPQQEWHALQQRDHELADRIDELRTRRDVLQAELRGHHFLEKVAGPWQRLGQLEAERDTLPPLDNFPADALRQYDQRQAEIDDTAATFQQARIESRQMKLSLRQARKRARIDQHAAALRILRRQADDFQPRTATLNERAARCKSLQQQCDARLKHLGSKWNRERVEALNVTPAGLLSLVEHGRTLQRARFTRAATVRRYRRAASRAHQRGQELNRIAGLAEGDQWDTILAAAREQLAAAREMPAQHSTLTAISGRLSALDRQAEQQADKPALPRYYYIVMAVFAAAGLALIAAAAGGFVTQSGTWTAWLAGAIYLLIGVCGAGLAWTLHRHFRPTAESADQLVRERENLLAEQTEAITTWNWLLEQTGHDESTTALTPGDTLPPHDTLAGWLTQHISRVAELEAASAQRERLRATRRRLSEVRGRIQQQQQTLAAARKDWCDALRGIGWSETLDVNEVLDTWRQAAELHHDFNRLHQEQRSLERDRQRLQSFQQDVADLAKHLTAGNAASTDAFTALANWEHQLQEAEQSRSEARRLLQAYRQQRRARKELRSRLSDLHAEQYALLLQADAGDREELVQLDAAMQRAAHLDERIDAARDELHTAAAAEPELAIVEDDLEAYSPHENRQALQTLEAERQALDEDIQQAREDLGRVRESLHTLTEDRHRVSLRFERAQIAARLQQAARQLLAVNVAGRALETVRERIERSHQPRTLERSSKWLSRLTGGRYVTVWTPLGSELLQVNDADGRSLGVEQLSKGTREQLYLALRIGLIHEAADRGVQLPLILDDVLVNFDNSRTQAAVETLQELGQAGQQILLLTCHDHLADQFRQRGIQPIPIGEQPSPLRHRRVG